MGLFVYNDTRDAKSESECLHSRFRLWGPQQYEEVAICPLGQISGIRVLHKLRESEARSNLWYHYIRYEQYAKENTRYNRSR